ncbi:SNF2-related protein [Kribbella sp. HUAS MG21]|uniref:SNF2-related protein n=1 Tax=Kribbella sp. HUAS MG21 TaxID=3160966 RepID=A0AAU7TI09_9ACTN
MSANYKSESFSAAPGAVVVVRDEEWLVTAVEPANDGHFVHVQGLSELVRETEATFSTALDVIKPLDPAAAKVIGDDSPQFRRTRLWLEATLRKTPVPLNDPALTVSTRGLADVLAYQQTAVRQALHPDNLRPRILLADAVGLGKTLEIGMILAELVRRGRGERILVVTPRHVLEQMQFELWTRFALPFVRLDSLGIQRIRQKLPASRNPFTYYKRVIISIDTLKSDRYLAHLQKQRWDAVVIDESHNVTNSAAQNNRLARLLAERTEALILASATPHNGRKESFAELVRMLEPSAVRPNGDLVEEDLKRLIIRRHRHSPDVASVVGANWAERREPQNILVPASDAENAIVAELEQTWLFPPSGSSPYSGATSVLFPWTLAKAFLSSPAALRDSIANRLRGLGTTLSSDQRHEAEALRRLDSLAVKAQDSGSAKYDALVDYLNRIGVRPRGTERAVIFAERIPTLHWLCDRLRADLGFSEDQVVVMHGGLSDVVQQEIVESFKQESSPIRVLVTGDVASEGVNLHTQCHELIHFDIPWSLIRIEQRNGRIDRYGQKHPPQITTLLLNPDSEQFAGDIRILRSLVEKEHEAHRALGDSASLMGEYDVLAEERAIRDVLAGKRDFDDVVRTPDQIRAEDGIEGLLARLLGTDSTDDEPTTADAEPAGVYDSDLAFLREALVEFLKTPDAEPPSGVSWREHTRHSIVELIPTPDLRQRLEVLPQSYLAERRVAEQLRLATTVNKGKAELAQALQDESSSLWPEAHYLSPLHPVLEWSTDRALSVLGRNEVFAVHGDVDDVTVVLQGTLTNTRGQVVASSYLTAAFPASEKLAFSPLTPYISAQTALASVGFTGSQVNTGALGNTADLQRYIAPAVKAAQSQMGVLVQAAADHTRERVRRWAERSREWDQEVDALIQRAEVKALRRRVDDERTMAELMLPDRTYVRPLLVVVPRGEA